MRNSLIQANISTASILKKKQETEGNGYCLVRYLLQCMKKLKLCCSRAAEHIHETLVIQDDCKKMHEPPNPTTMSAIYPYAYQKMVQVVHLLIVFPVRYI